MNHELENRLRDGLAEQNNAIEIEGAGPTAAANRAVARAKQLGMARGMATIAVIACLGALAFTQFSDGNENFVATDKNEDDDSNVDILDGDRVNDVGGMDFTSSIIDGGDQSFGQFLSDEGQLVQITTQPGVKWEDMPPEGPTYVVTVSTSDGVTESNPLPKGMSPTSASYYEGVLYTVTTSPKNVNNGNDVIVNTSTDKGKSWSSTSIDLGPVPNPELNNVWHDAQVTANEVGVLLSVRSNYWIDYAKLLPQYSYEEGNFEIRPTEAGLEVRDWTAQSELSEAQAIECDSIMEGVESPTEEQFAEMEKCWESMEQLPEPEVIDSFSWEELGIEPTPSNGEINMFFSPDGNNFEQVTPPSENSSNYVAVNDTGFLTQSYSNYGYEDCGYGCEPTHGEFEEPSPIWYLSSDGRTWNEVAVPPNSCNVVGSQGNVFISQSCDQSGIVHVSSDNGTSWRQLAEVPTDAADDYMSYVSVYGGDLGFVAFRNTEPDYSLLDEAYADAEAEGRSDQEMADLERDFFENSDRSFDVLFSADGQSWTKLDLPGELSGKNVWADNALIGSQNIVLSLGTSDESSFRVQKLFLTPS